MYALYGATMVLKCITWPHEVVYSAASQPAAYEELVDFLTYGFAAGYEGPVPSPYTQIIAAAKAHPRDTAVYITTELGHGAMLGPFDHSFFTPCCQVNPLLTHPKKDTNNRTVILDLSWSLPPVASVHRETLRDTYLGVSKKMHLPLAHDLPALIRHAGKRALLFSCNISHVYIQLPLNPADWSLVSFKEAGCYYMDASLQFGLRWAVASCQDATSLVASHLNSKGLWLLNYIDDFRGVASSREEAEEHFSELQAPWITWTW